MVLEKDSLQNSQQNVMDMRKGKLEEERKKKEVRFCQLCYRIFEKTADGVELLGMLHDFAALPVANPKESPNFAFFREGENNIIRRFDHGISEAKIGER